jgi:hypothetical protein
MRRPLGLRWLRGSIRCCCCSFAGTIRRWHGCAGHHHLCRLYWASATPSVSQQMRRRIRRHQHLLPANTLSPHVHLVGTENMIRPSLGNGRPSRHPALSLKKLSEPSLWTRPETTRTPDAATTDPVQINTPPSISICPTVGAKCCHGETTYAMGWLKWGRTRCWRIRVRGTS